MELAWKEDWPAARERLLAWWEREALGRPCLQIFAPRTPADLPVLAAMPRWWPGPADELDPATGAPRSMDDRWLRADYLLPSKLPYFPRIYWGGEAFPYFFTNQGPVSIPAYLGSPWTFDARTGWGEPCLEDYSASRPTALDPHNRYWQATLEITRAALEAFRGRGLVSVSDLGSGGDELAMLRGNRRLLEDLLDCPERVKEALDWVEGWLPKYYEPLFELLYPAQGATVTWLGTYYEGRTVTLQCDFSCMISPAMFEEFFLPVIQRQAARFDRVCYHLDGPGAVRHLDAILSLPEIHAIQWVPGAGAPPMSEWLALLKRIQAGGKAVHAGCGPHEVEKLVRELKPEGLCLATFAPSRELADEFIKKTESWAARSR